MPHREQSQAKDKLIFAHSPDFGPETTLEVALEFFGRCHD
jgi:hypothetical protein